MVQYNFLCHHCGTQSEAQYSAFIQELGALPLLWGEWDFVEYLRSYSRCSSCGYVFQPLFETSPANGVTPPILLQRFALQAIKGAPDHTMHSPTIPPISADSVKKGLVTRGFCCDVSWNIDIWIAVAVVSGVMGHLSEEVITRAIITVRTTLLERRNQLHTGAPETHNSVDKQTTLDQVCAYVQEARTRSVREGHALYERPPLDPEVDPYVRWWMEFCDTTHKKRIEKWSILTHDHMERLISKIYEYAVKRMSILTGGTRVPSSDPRRTLDRHE
ncbi:MAG: hypothetical protein MRJ68_11845 [Nitrospira sp.]|nr:hypothetical protein [Nitrospira sp.]